MDDVYNNIVVFGENSFDFAKGRSSRTRFGWSHSLKLDEQIVYRHGHYEIIGGRFANFCPTKRYPFKFVIEFSDDVFGIISDMVTSLWSLAILDSRSGPKLELSFKSKADALLYRMSV